MAETTIEDELTSLISLENIMNDSDGKACVAPFAYDSAGYQNETESGIKGVTEYSYANNQNIPVGNASTLETNSTTLAKGLRAQASSLSRQLVNHFFGRMSFNLNKIHEWFGRFLGAYQKDLRQNGNLWNATTAYMNGDLCFQRSIVDNKQTARFFRCISSTALGLINYPPIKSDNTVDTEHWQECNVFDELYAVQFHGEATDVADGSITTEKLADGSVTRSKLSAGALGIFRCRAMVHGVETFIPLTAFTGFEYDSEASYTVLLIPDPSDRTFIVTSGTIASDGVRVYPHYVENGEVKAGTGYSPFTFSSSFKFGKTNTEGNPIVFGQEDLSQDTFEMSVLIM